MPEKDGLEFLKELRQNGNNIPFIVFTCKGREEVVIKALNMGADYYVSKSGDSESVYTELAHSIRETVESRNVFEMLKDSEEKYKSLVENSKDSIVVIDLKGNVLFANKATEKLTGYTDMMTRVNVRQVTPLRYWPKSLTMLLKARKGEQIPYFESIIRRKDGSLVPVETGGQAILRDGKVVGVQIITRDISDRKQREQERKKAEEELRQSEGKFRKLFNEAMDAIFIADAETGILVDCNQAATELVGRAKSELVGKHQRILHPETETEDKRFSKTFHQHVGEREGQVLETQAITKNGEIKEVAIKANIIELGNRKILQGVFRDITERKCYERSLSALNTYGRKLNTAKSMEEIYELTLDAAEKTLGFEFADIFRAEGKMLQLVTHRGKTKISSLSLPMDGDLGVSVKAAKTGSPVLVPDINKEEAYVEGEEGGRSEFAVPIKIGSKVLGVLNVESKELDAFKERDQELLEILASHAATAISNLDRASELEAYAREIRESKHRFEGLFLGNPEATICLAPDFSILDINPRFRELFGYSLSEIKGKHIDEVVVPRDKVNEAEILNKKAVEGYVYHDTLRITKDGSPIPVSISAAPIRVEGKLVGYIGVYKDISDLKETERKLESTNEKLRVVGGLTRHDARNKLSTITGNTYLLKKQLAGNKEALDKLVDIETAVQQTAKIFDFARTYETLGAEDHVYVDVEKTVNEAISLFPSLDNIKIANDCHGLTVLADSLLRQLFYNLIDNSLKYGQRTTKIRTYYERTSQNELKLVYEDDGAGIPSTEKPKLFKEGHSTGGSTGYGLYLIKKMIEVYDWSIQETGEPDKGARFTMTIPRMNTNGKENYRIG